MLNYNHLYYFYVFVREGGVSAAARKLRISQPALSAQLKRLESQLGERLATRGGRVLVLTERGKLVYSYARQMFSISAELINDVQGVPSQKELTRLQIGVSPQVETRFAFKVLAPALPVAGGAPSPLSVQLAQPSHEELVRRLKSRMLDIAITPQPAYSEGIEAVGQIRLPVRLLASPAFSSQFKGERRFLERNLIGMMKLFDIGYMLPSPEHRLRAEIDLFFEGMKATPKTLIEADSVAALLQGLVDRAGVGLLPEAYAAEEIRSGKLLAFGPKKGFWIHTVHVLARRSPAIDPHVERLNIDHFKL